MRSQAAGTWRHPPVPLQVEKWKNLVTTLAWPARSDLPRGQAWPGLHTPPDSRARRPIPAGSQEKARFEQALSAAPQPQGAWPGTSLPSPMPLSPGPPSKGHGEEEGGRPQPLLATTLTYRRCLHCRQTPPFLGPRARLEERSSGIALQEHSNRSCQLPGGRASRFGACLPLRPPPPPGSPSPSPSTTAAFAVGSLKD